MDCRSALIATRDSLLRQAEVLNEKIAALPAEKHYRPGARFIHVQPWWGRGEEYILAGVGPHQVVLIHLDTGDRYTEPVTVRAYSTITAEELRRCFGKGEFVEKT